MKKFRLDSIYISVISTTLWNQLNYVDKLANLIFKYETVLGKMIELATGCIDNYDSHIDFPAAGAKSAYLITY